MDISSLQRLKKPEKKDSHIHSAHHALAKELSEGLNDKKSFPVYLGLTGRHPEIYLRNIYNEVKRSKTKTPGKLFLYLVKKGST